MKLVADDLVNLKAKLPPEADKERIELQTPEIVRETLEDVKHILISRLLSAGLEK